MSPNPKVSILICSYNQAGYIVDAVESALAQTYENVEIIIIDNGSTDGTPKILEQYNQNTKIRLFLHDTNAAVTKRLNEGIQASTGDFISILYADDYYLQNKITYQMKAFESLGTDYGVVYTPGIRLNEVTKEQFSTLSLRKSGYILNSMFRDYHRDGFIDPISPLVRRECFIDYPFREHVFIEGEGIYFRIAQTYKFKYLDKPLSVMRDHMSNAGKAIKKTKEYEVILITELLQEMCFPELSKKHAIRYLARVLRNYAWQALRLGQERTWARRTFFEAVSWDPLQLMHPRTLAGLLLSIVPLRILVPINQIASRTLNRPGLLILKENNV